MTTVSRNSHDSEKWLEHELVRRVASLGGKALKYSSMTETGFPDRLVILNGHYWWVELKTRGEKPRVLQIHRINQLRKLGCKVYVVNSEECLDEFMELIVSEDE